MAPPVQQRLDVGNRAGAADTVQKTAFMLKMAAFNSCII